MKPPLEIMKLPQMKSVTPEFLEKMIALERDTWGRRTAIHEYAVCSDAACRAQIPIEEVYGESTKDTPLAQLEIHGTKLPPCPECHSPTEPYLKPKPFAQYTQAFFEMPEYDIFGALLVDENNQVEGMAYSAIATRKAILEAINYRNAYNLNKVLENIQKIFGGDDTTTSASLYKIILSPKFRGSGHFRRLANAMMDARAEKLDDIEMISDTSPHSDLYPFFQAIGMKDIATDPHGWVICIQERSETLRKAMCMDKVEFQAKYGEDFRQAKTKQKEYIEKRNPHHMRRFYRNAVMLKE